MTTEARLFSPFFLSPLNCEIVGLNRKKVAFGKRKSTLELEHQGLVSGIYILHVWNKQGPFN